MRLDSSDPDARLSKLAFIAGGLGLAAVIAVATHQASAGGGSGLGALTPSAVSTQAPAGSAFWEHWGDGRAELNGYRLTQPRYGAPRSGSVVHIFVTEPFSYEARVKADPGRHPKSDVFQVLKLNVAKDFQTGIYDYNTMTSVFVPVEPHPRVRVGHPTKLTFSSQEWCGMLFEQLLFEPKRIDQKRFSYFDGEGAESDVLANPTGGLAVDALPIALRGLLGGALLEPGSQMKRPFLPSVERARLLHRPLAWLEGSLSRSADRTKVEVQAGRFEVDTYAVSLTNGDRYVYWVESAYPHRVVAWDGPDGERAELLGSARLPYWQLNQPGDASHLRALGLQPPR